MRVVYKCMIEDSCVCCVCRSIASCILPFCGEVFLLTNLHEFRGQPIGLERQGALSCLNGICREGEKRQNKIKMHLFNVFIFSHTSLFFSPTADAT